jgi:hypothetical protein
VPAELHANRMQWLIRLCVIRCYVSVMWRPGMHRSVRLRCQVRTQNLINHCIRFACNSAGTEEFPDDDTHVSKHVGAAE